MNSLSAATIRKSEDYLQSQLSNNTFHLSDSAQNNKILLPRSLKFVSAIDPSNNSPPQPSQSKIHYIKTKHPSCDFNFPTRHLFAESEISALLSWKTKSTVGSGLRNLGNSCFMNATLQCLCYTPAFQNLIASQYHSKKCRKCGFCVLCQLEKLLPAMLYSSNGSQVPSSIFRNLRLLSKSLKPGRQEDAHEFLRYLMDALQTAVLEQCPKKIKENRVRETSAIHKIWGGYLRSQVKCTDCGFESNSYEAILDLSLEIKGSSVQSAFRNFTDPEILDGDNKYNCPECKTPRRAVKQFTIFDAPNVLVLHLKRFAFDFSAFGFGGGARRFGNSKINKFVEFSPTLDITQFMSYKMSQTVTYNLFGVLVHYGHSAHGGHYVSYILAPNKKWYLLDDSRCMPAKQANVLKEKAYLLFYTRNETRTKCTPLTKSPKSPRFPKPKSPKAMKSPKLRQHQHQTKTKIQTKTKSVYDLSELSKALELEEQKQDQKQEQKPPRKIHSPKKHIKSSIETKTNISTSNSYSNKHLQRLKSRSKSRRTRPNHSEEEAKKKKTPKHEFQRLGEKRPPVLLDDEMKSPKKKTKFRDQLYESKSESNLIDQLNPIPSSRSTTLSTASDISVQLRILKKQQMLRSASRKSLWKMNKRLSMLNKSNLIGRRSTSIRLAAESAMHSAHLPYTTRARTRTSKQWLTVSDESSDSILSDLVHCSAQTSVTSSEELKTQSQPTESSPVLPLLPLHDGSSPRTLLPYNRQQVQSYLQNNSTVNCIGLNQNYNVGKWDTKSDSTDQNKGNNQDNDKSRNESICRTYQLDKPLVSKKDEWDLALDMNLAYPHKSKCKSNPFRKPNANVNSFQIAQTQSYSKSHRPHKRLKLLNSNKNRFSARKRRVVQY